MKRRTRNKIHKQFAEKWGIKKSVMQRGVFGSDRRYRCEILRDLQKQVDDAMEYHYGKYCR